MVDDDTIETEQCPCLKPDDSTVPRDVASDFHLPMLCSASENGPVLPTSGPKLDPISSVKYWLKNVHPDQPAAQMLTNLVSIGTHTAALDTLKSTQSLVGDPASE